jgi:hypothetical protein
LLDAEDKESVGIFLVAYEGISTSVKVRDSAVVAWLYSGFCHVESLDFVGLIALSRCAKAYS